MAVLATAAGVPFAVLPALLVVPAAGALLVAVLPRRRPELVKLVAVATSMVVAAMTVCYWSPSTSTVGPTCSSSFAIPG